MELVDKIGVIYWSNKENTEIMAEKISNGLIYTTLSRFFWSTAFLFVPFIEKLGAVLFCAVLEFTVFAMSVLLFIISIDGI